jgi:uncharacterized protein (TIGR02284 family)
MSDEITALQKMYTTLVDSLKGYVEALKDSDGAGMTQVFRDMISLRTRHRSELAAAIRMAGGTVDETTSFMGTVHKTVVGIRAAVVGLDQSALPAFVSGEQHIVSAYDAAIKSAPAHLTLLQAQRGDLLKQIAILERKAA